MDGKLSSICIISLSRAPFVGFEVLTPLVTKNAILWDIMPCNLLKVNQHFGGTYSLHLQLLAICFHTGILLVLFNPEDESGIILPNVG
jgi:hypothetical protein